MPIGKNRVVLLFAAALLVGIIFFVTQWYSHKPAKDRLHSLPGADSSEPARRARRSQKAPRRQDANEDSHEAVVEEPIQSIDFLVNQVSKLSPGDYLRSARDALGWNEKKWAMCERELAHIKPITGHKPRSVPIEYPVWFYWTNLDPSLREESMRGYSNYLMNRIKENRALNPQTATMNEATTAFMAKCLQLLQESWTRSADLGMRTNAFEASVKKLHVRFPRPTQAEVTAAQKEMVRLGGLHVAAKEMCNEMVAAFIEGFSRKNYY